MILTRKYYKDGVRLLNFRTLFISFLSIIFLSYFILITHTQIIKETKKIFCKQKVKINKNLPLAINIKQFNKLFTFLIYLSIYILYKVYNKKHAFIWNIQKKEKPSNENKTNIFTHRTRTEIRKSILFGHIFFIFF